jgi:hypothetical protein
MDMKSIVCLGLVLILCSTSAMAAPSATASTSSSTTTGSSATNVVIDFASTSFNANVRKGDTGVMNLVVKNTGGWKATNVLVAIISTGAVRTDKKIDLGDMDPGDSKSMPVIFFVDMNARTGLTSIPVQISYDGYKSDGTSDNNKLATFEIPFNVLGNPLFQITPSQTAYSQDSVAGLNLTGTTKDPVKDLEVTLSSNCLTVMGSSRSYIGNVGANREFHANFPIKPSKTGACVSSLYLSYTDESGGKASDNVSVGLNINDAGVDFKVTNVSYDPTGPGEDTNLRIRFKNVGSSEADDVTIYLNITAPFAPIGSSEIYIPSVGAGAEAEADFNLAVGWTADTTSYAIPVTMTYKVGGTTTTVVKTIGLDVLGRVTLEVMDVQVSGGNVRVDVANIGTRTADGVKATLIVPYATSGTLTTGTGRARGGENGSFRSGDNASQGQGMQRIISYKSDIKSTKQTTFTFPTTATGQATLELEYSGPNNERITQTERISLSGGTTSLRSTTASTSTSWTTYGIAAVVLVAAYLGYRKYKGAKSK